MQAAQLLAGSDGSAYGARFRSGYLTIRDVVGKVQTLSAGGGVSGAVIGMSIEGILRAQGVRFETRPGSAPNPASRSVVVVSGVASIDSSVLEGSPAERGAGAQLDLASTRIHGSVYTRGAGTLRCYGVSRETCQGSANPNECPAVTALP